jgi:hypothetical protein
MDLFAPNADVNDYGSRSKKNVSVGSLVGCRLVGCRLVGRLVERSFSHLLSVH